MTAWGWVHLILGILIVATGFGLFGRRAWAGVTGILLAMLSAIAKFMFIPYYPIWALLVIAPGHLGDLGAHASGRDRDLS